MKKKKKGPKKTDWKNKALELQVIVDTLTVSLKQTREQLGFHQQILGVMNQQENVDATTASRKALEDYVANLKLKPQDKE